jgi:hypothetical protein
MCRMSHRLGRCLLPEYDQCSDKPGRDQVFVEGYFRLEVIGHQPQITPAILSSIQQTQHHLLHLSTRANMKLSLTMLSIMLASNALAIAVKRQEDTPLCEYGADGKDAGLYRKRM